MDGNGVPNVAGFEPNDTQPLPSQVFNEYMNSVANSKDQAPTNAQFDGNWDDAREAANHTYATGETGHIDIAGDEDTYKQGAMLGDDEVNVSEDELIQEDTQTREGVVTSPARMSPVTPALAGSKRDRQGNILNSVERTPAPDLTAMFGKGPAKPTVGLSQIFHQTQGFSSPLMGGIRSDPIFERPSPDFRPDTAHRSSPGRESSPVYARKGALQRANTDPRDVYVSLRDSQEYRKHKENDIQRRLEELEDQDELSQDTEELKADLRRQKAAIAAGTSKLFGTVGRRRVDKRRKVLGGDPKTPATQNGKAAHAILISDDTPRIEGRDVDLADLVDLEDESETGSRDEYDELSQTVINIPRNRTRKTHATRLDNHRPSSSPARQTNGAQMHVQDARLTHSFHSGSNSHNTRSSNAENNASSQTLQVPYSQSGIIDAYDSLPPRPPRPVLASSTDTRTFISQSQQDHSLPSNTKARIRSQISSSIPLAPLFPSDGGEGQNEGEPMPSSPPSSPPGATTPDTSQPNQLANGEATGESQGEGNIEYGDMRPVHPRKKALRRVPDTSPSSSALANPQPSETAEAVPDSPSASMPQMNGSAGSRHDLQRSNSTGAFDTARTHQSEPSVPATRTTRQSNGVPTKPSAKKQAGQGKMQSIVLDPTPPDRKADIDTGMDVLNDGDTEYGALMSENVDDKQEPRKRTRTSYCGRRALQDPSKEQNRLPAPQNDTFPTAEHARAGKRPSARESQKVPEMPDVESLDELQRTQAPDVPTQPTPRSTRNSIKPVVSGSHQRDLTGEASQWKPRMPPPPTTGRLKSVSKKQKPATLDQLPPPQLEIDTNVNIASSESRFMQRVLAYFKPGSGAYYTATLAGTDGDMSQIHYDDGDEDTVLSHLVRPLILRPGDQVRIALPKYKGKTCTVQGVSDPLSQGGLQDNEIPMTDVFGNRVVSVTVKRRSSTGTSTSEAAIETVQAPISKVYIMPTAWKPFVNRFLDVPSAVSTTRLETPTGIASAPNTPTSRHRRRTLPITAPLPTQKASFQTDSKPGIFSNMAFAISLGTQTPDDAKRTLTRLIQTNGGSLIPDNFDTLFTSTPTSTSTPAGPQSTDLTLLPTAAKLGFIALLADHHSRREKYMQALSLAIPCLSSRWIHDSVSKSQTQPWDRYLLPSGESSVLNGAVRSRILTGPFDAQAASLANTIGARSKLLRGKKVIFLVGKGQAEQRRRTFIFLTQALGVDALERVKDVAAAKTLLGSGGIEVDYVYVGEGDVDAAASELGAGGKGKAAGGAGKQRARKSVEGVESGMLSVELTDKGRQVRVIGNEFLVQTLILGALVEGE